MSIKPVFARAVAEALFQHFTKCNVPVYWVTEKDRQWPYAPSTPWPEQPSLDFHIRNESDGFVVRVIQNNDFNPLAGEILLAVKFEASLIHAGAYFEALAKFFRDLDVSTL